MNSQVLSIIQIILGVILTGIILLQSKGTGLGSTFGGEMGFYRTKRGAERLLFYFTMIVSALFMISSVVQIIL